MMMLKKEQGCKNTVLWMVLSCMVILGCNDVDQDKGGVNQQQQTVSGLVIDGYLARAIVYFDSNNNGTRDAWEAYSFTDNDGYFSYNPLVNIDYCAASASPQQQEYCLRSDVTYDDVVLRIDGGYDVITGEPFIGSLSHRINVTEATGNSQVVSPVTSLITFANNEQQRQQILTSLELTESDISVDYFSQTNSQLEHNRLLKTALTVHKVVTVLSDRLTDSYTEIGNAIGTPNDASSFVYRHLTTSLLQNNNTLDQILGDQEELMAVMDKAEASLRTVYDQEGLNLPTNSGSTQISNGFARAIDIAQQIPSLVDALISDDDVLDQNQVIGAARALEAVVIKTVNEKTTNDASIEQAIAFFSDEDDDEVVSVLEALGSDQGDVSGLVSVDFSNTSNVIDAAKREESVAPLLNLVGYQVKLSDLDSGSAPSNLQDIELEIYFSGEPTATNGDLNACIKFIDEANIDGQLGEGNTRGELVAGYWSLLNPSQATGASFNALLTLTFLGATYQAILQPDEARLIDGVTYQGFKIDFDGELTLLNSQQGILETISIPQSNLECEQRLPSRIGL